MSRVHAVSFHLLWFKLPYVIHIVIQLLFDCGLGIVSHIHLYHFLLYSVWQGWSVHTWSLQFSNSFLERCDVLLGRSNTKLRELPKRRLLQLKLLEHSRRSVRLQHARRLGLEACWQFKLGNGVVERRGLLDFSVESSLQSRPHKSFHSLISAQNSVWGVFDWGSL